MNTPHQDAATTQWQQANLAVIAERFPEVHRALRDYTRRATAKTEISYRYQQARRGGGSIQVSINDTWIWLYSSINPTGEADRAAEQICATQPPPAIIMCTTLGNAYLIERCLERLPHSDVVILERNLALLSCALTGRDLTDLLRCPRLHIAHIQQEAPLETVISRLYLPALHGQAHIVWNKPLAQHLATERTWHGAIRRVAEQMYGSLSIYRRLGRLWCRNILLNGAHLANQKAQQDATPPWISAGGQSKKTVAVVAAGPSLDDQLSLLKSNRRRYGENGQYALISTDSALPALCKQNIEIDACVTLDCQLHTYLHFLTVGAQRIPLYADITIHPTLYRQHHRTIIPTESAHPLSLLIEQHLPLSSMQSRSEHVTQNALALAIASGAQQIILYGADYAYQSGKGYARGTYIPMHYLNRSSYLQPYELQSLLFSWQHNERSSTTRVGKSIVPQFFRDYQEQLTRYAAQHGYTIATENTPGIITFTREAARESANHHAVSAAGTARAGAGTAGGAADAGTVRGAVAIADTAADHRAAWQRFLNHYRHAIRALPLPTPPYLRYIQQLSHDQLLTLLSLIPLMTHICGTKRQTNSTISDSTLSGIFKRTRHTVEKYIDALLS